VQRDKRQIEASLVAKGFERQEGDHHFFCYRATTGKKTMAFTKTSHTPKMKTITDELLSRMAKQCKLNKQKFIELIDCPLDRQGYEKLLASQELL
jgi:hypothetical protein